MRHLVGVALTSFAITALSSFSGHPALAHAQTAEDGGRSMAPGAVADPPMRSGSRQTERSSMSPSSVGCTDESAGGPEPAPEPYDVDAPTSNVLIDLLIPTLVPILLGERQIDPGDATIILRWSVITNSAWFDTVAPYHPTQVGVYSDLGRRPANESATNGDMNTALMYSGARIMTWCAAASLSI